MGIGLVAAGQQLEHSAPVERLALAPAVVAAMADGRPRNSSFAAQHQRMHQPIEPFVVVHPVASIQLPDQMAVV